MQSALELRNASYDTLLLPSTENLRSIAEHYEYRRNQIPMGILYSTFTHIDTIAVEKGYIIIDGQGNPRPTERLKREGLQEKDVLMTSLLADKREVSQQVSFVLPKELIIGNRANRISHIEVDFGDGQGFRTAHIGIPLDVNYETSGEKVITFKVTTEIGNTFQSNSFIVIRSDEGWGDFENNVIFQDTIYADIPFAGSNGNFQGMGLVTYLFNDADMKLRKPVLIVDGFDPGNQNNSRKIFNQYLMLIINLPTPSTPQATTW